MLNRRSVCESERGAFFKKMVVINIETEVCYENLNQKKVAGIVGVNRNTIARWRQRFKVKRFREFIIYLFTFDL